MSRTSRIFPVGIPQHIIQRGNNRQVCFASDEDFSAYAQWLHEAASRYIRDASGAFRVVYIAKFAEAVYVLHCFQKKTQKTSKTDLDLARLRYRELLQEREP